MKRIEFSGTIYDAPEHVFEMTLGRWIDLAMLTSQGGERSEELSYQMELLACISTIPLDAIREMDFNTFVKLVELCEWPEEFKLPEVVTPEEIGQTPSKDEIAFEVDGETYMFQPDFAYTRLSVASKVEDLLRDRTLLPDNLHYLLAIAAHKPGEVFDIASLDAKAMKMCNARMIDVFKPLVFFCLSGADSLLFTRNFSRAPRAKAIASAS